MIKEIEGELSSDSLEALLYAQNTAEEVHMQLLSEEFRLSKARYEGFKFNWIPLMRCLLPKEH